MKPLALFLMGIGIFGAAGIVLAEAPVAEAPLQNFQLQDMEDVALQNSPKYQAAQLDFESSRAKSQSQQAQLFPKLSLEGSYRYVTEVPNFQAAPGAPLTQFGDNKNYSYGPMISWTAFATGNLYNRYRSLDAASRAKFFDSETIRRQILLDTRLNYFQVQMALEEVRLLADSLKLTESQYKDISVRRQAGVVGRIDELTAHQEMLQRAEDLRQAQGNLAAAIQNLFAVTGRRPTFDTAVPFDARLKSVRLPETETPTALVSVDGVESSQKLLNGDAVREPDLTHPNIQSLTENARSARLLAQSLESGHGPTVNVMAKASRDYPNGPVLDPINQKTLGVSASWSIFEAGRVMKDVRAQEKIAQSTEKRREQAEIDLKRDWDKAQETLQALRYRNKINKRMVEENKTLADLIYESYKAGRSNILDVDAANLRLLSAQVSLVRTEVQILMQLAILDSLSVPVR